MYEALSTEIEGGFTAVLIADEPILEQVVNKTTSNWPEDYGSVRLTNQTQVP